jgi:integrase
MGVVVRQKVPGKGNPWWVFVAHNKKRTSRMVGSRKAADDVADEIRVEIKRGTFNFESNRPVEEPEIPTIKEYSEKWINNNIPVECKSSTQKDYRVLLKNHILPEFGESKVSEINRGMVKEFLYKKIQDGYARSTVLHMKNVISGILRCAVDDEVIQVNCTLDLKERIKKRIENGNGDAAANSKADFLTRKELSTLLTNAKEHFPRHYPLCLLLARTGMRIGEALALQWGDIDFNSRFITVQRGLCRGRIETPKSGKKRTVDMSMQLAETLKTLKNQPPAPTVVPIRKPESINVIPLVPMKEAELTDFIFQNETGGLIDPDNWRRRIFNAILKKAEMRKIRIHDLRHTYASLMIEANESLPYIQAQMGHSSIKVTVDVYGHLIKGGNKAAVDRLDDSGSVIPNAPPVHPEDKTGGEAIGNNGVSI